MSLVMIVDDVAIIREPIAASLRASGFQTVCAAGGEEALAALRTTRPDLVLLDLSMPKVDGMTVLRGMRSEPATARVPVILLTASSDKRHVIQAAKLGVRDYLLKSRFSLPELVARVRKYVNAPEAGASQPDPEPEKPAVAVAPAPATIPVLLNRDKCVARAEQALHARTLSGAVAQVISLAASPRGDLSALSTLIARDPILSARILQAANSASYANSRGAVATVPEAVRKIGCAAVRDIAATLGVFDAMPPCGADGFNPIRCWQHSFAVANLCQQLAADGDTGPAYLVGLCHDLGEILFHTHFASEYRRVLEVQQTSGKRRDEVERIMLGMTHGELVQTILRKLGLPDGIRGPIEEHHSLSGRVNSPLARLLRVADLYANGLMLASSGQSLVAPIPLSDLRAAIGRDDPPQPDADALRGQTFALTAMLARLSADDEAELMRIPYARRSAKVLVVRESALSAFDPVVSALQCLADVDVRSGLPAMSSLRDYQGMVILARSTTASGLGASELAATLGAPGSVPIPVLWLAGRIEPLPLPAGAPVPSPWPVCLDALDRFVGGLEQKNAA